MKDKDQLIRHGTIMLIATVLSGIFNYGYHIVMIRMLGPADYGILFSLTALFMIISLPAGTIQTIIAKYISSFRTQGQSGKMSYLMVRTVKKLSKILGVLLIIYLLLSKLIAGYLNISMLMPVVIIGPVLFFGLLFPINFGALQGLERFTELGFVQILGAFLRILLGVLLVYIGWGVSGALLASLLSASFILWITWWFLRDIWAVRPYDEDIGKRGIYKYFIPVSIAYICFGIVTYIDAVIVKHYFPALEAGYYSSVSMIGKAFLFPPMAFAGAMFPKVSSQYEQGKHTGQLLYKTLIYSGIVCIAGILICISFPKPIIYVLMRRADITKDALNIMIPLLRYVGFAITPYGLACIVINYYLARHWTRFLPYLIIGTVLQIACLVFFHNTLIQVLTVLFVAGIFILLCGVFGRLYGLRGYSKKS